MLRRGLAGGFVLNGRTHQRGFSCHAKEEVVLEGERCRNDLQAEDTTVVGVVYEAEVEESVVLEHQGAKCHVGIQTHEGTHTLGDGVVYEAEALYGGCLTDVEHVTAYGAVFVDLADLAAVVTYIAEHHSFAPLIDETLGVVGNDAVLVGDVADDFTVLGASVLVLDGKAESRRSGSCGSAVKADILEVQVLAVPGVCNMELTCEHRHVAVGVKFARERETGGNIHGLNVVRRTFQLKVKLCS